MKFEKDPSRRYLLSRVAGIAFLMTVLAIQSCAPDLAGSPTKLVPEFTPISISISPPPSPTGSPSSTPFSADNGQDPDENRQINVSSLPVGNYIAYCSFDGLDQEGLVVNSIFVMDIEGEVFGRLAYDACRSIISSDGRILLFDRMDYSKMDYYLILLELETDQEHVISNSFGCSSGSLSPDCKQIVASCRNNISIFQLESGTKRMIIDCESMGGACGSPSWSPDGRYIVYDYLEVFSPNSGAFLLDTECIQSGAECIPSRITSPNFGFYSWSPDSDRIAFPSDNGAISLCDIPSGTLHTLNLPKSSMVRGIAFSPSGQELALTLDGYVGESKRIYLFNLNDGSAEYIGDNAYRKAVLFWIKRTS